MTNLGTRTRETDRSLHPLYQNTFEGSTERKMQRLTRGTVITCGILLTVLYIAKPTDLPFTQASLGCLIVLLGTLPSVLYLKTKYAPPLPLVPLTGLFYAAAFGAPIFYDFSTASVYNPYSEISTEALLIAASALIAFYIGYYLSARSLLKALQPIHLPHELTLSRLRLALWCLLALHLAGLLFPAIFRSLYLMEFLGPAGYVAYGMFLICWTRKRMPGVEVLILLLVAVPVEVITRLVSGSVAPVLLMGFFLLLVIWIEHRRIPWMIVTCAAILFAFLNYSKGEYRALTWGNGPYASAGTVEKTRIFAEVFVDKFADEHTQRVFESTVTRVSQLGFLTYVVEQTPSVVPYWNGESYFRLFYALIPRLLWTAKPTENLGYELSRRYGMRDTADESTSFNVPWIVEMYANFGWIGVIGGMGIIGLAFAFCEAKLNRPGLTTLELMVGAAVLFDLFYQESNLSLMVGSKVLLALSLYLFFQLMLRGRAGTRNPSNRCGGAPAVNVVRIEQT